jgi:hypothetical protein
MQIRRTLILLVAVAWVGTLSPMLAAQNQNNQRREPEKRSKQEQQDVEALVKLVDGLSAGSQPAPTDIPIAWESNHFVRGADGATYVPFTLTVDRSKVPSPAVAMYVRVVSKDAAPPAPPATGNNRDRNQQQQRVTYPWDNVHFLDLPADGKVQRAMALKPGNYEAIIAVKERTPEQPQRNAPPQKVGVVRHDLTIPDFNKPELQTSSVIVATSIEPVTTPLTAAQQQEQPYSFGAMKVVPSPDAKLKKSGELQVLFWVYGAGNNGGKPDLTIDYNFYQKMGDSEKYFNKTAPQDLNAQTLPPQFDVAAGHQLPGSLVVPLASFPEGDYRLEIKINDKISGKMLTQTASFSVVAG